jgi:hypothetical protein
MKDFVKLLTATGQTLNLRAKEAGQWFRDSIDRITRRQKTDPKQVFNKDSTPQIGRMYMFVYDAKHKDTLPYFDMYPLVIPIEFYGDGFLGINFHYLPPLARARLLDALTDISNNDKYDDTTKLNISYEVLKISANRFKGFENCIKRYLFSQVRSGFHYVSPADWNKAVLMPIQKWHINPNKKYARNPPY